MQEKKRFFGYDIHLMLSVWCHLRKSLNYRVIIAAPSPEWTRPVKEVARSGDRPQRRPPWEIFSRRGWRGRETGHSGRCGLSLHQATSNDLTQATAVLLQRLKVELRQAHKRCA